MQSRKQEVINKAVIIASEDATQGARRATGDASSDAARPNPEVVPLAARRKFSAAEKNRILNLADNCTGPGEIGALLRREGPGGQLKSRRSRSINPLSSAVAGGGVLERPVRSLCHH
jgi:hypothetical protein